MSVSSAGKSKINWCVGQWYWPKYGFCPSKRAWDSMIKQFKVKDGYGYPVIGPQAGDGITSSFMNKDNGKLIILVSIAETLDRDIKKRCVVDLISHEAVHVWQHIREDIGEDNPSSEFEAYSIQTIVSELIGAYEATRGKLFLPAATRKKR